MEVDNIMKKFLKNRATDVAQKATTAVAKNNANTVCGFALHQPQLPEKVKKLRKF